MVLFEEFTWRAEGNNEFRGAQIDLMIRRADNIINLCEMKFSIADYVLRKEGWIPLLHSTHAARAKLVKRNFRLNSPPTLNKKNDADNQ